MARGRMDATPGLKCQVYCVINQSLSSEITKNDHRNDPVRRSRPCAHSADSKIDSDLHVSTACSLNFDPNGRKAQQKRRPMKAQDVELRGVQSGWKRHFFDLVREPFGWNREQVDRRRSKLMRWGVMGTLVDNRSHRTEHFNCAPSSACLLSARKHTDLYSCGCSPLASKSKPVFFWLPDVL